MRLDETKLGELRRWGHRLMQEAGDEGSVAAGRAILMLVDELEQARFELRRTREQLDRLDRTSSADLDAGKGDTVASTLHGRLQRALGRDSDQSLDAQPESPGNADPTSGSSGDSASARSWIETLRRDN